MKRCSPVETRKNMELARELSSIGIDFICVPVSSNASRHELITQMGNALEALVLEAEREEYSAGMIEAAKGKSDDRS